MTKKQRELVQSAYNNHSEIRCSTMYSEFYGTVARYDETFIDLCLNSDHGFVVIPASMIIDINA